MKTNAGILLVFSLFLLASCATTSINYWVNRPAEINLHDFPQIAIGDIETAFPEVQHAYAIRDAFTIKLIRSDFFDAVLDRQHLESLMQEHYLAWSGLMDEDSAWQLGQLLGASALVYGSVTRDEYRENITQREFTRKDKQGNAYPVTEYVRKGEYFLSVSVRVIDTQTSRILGIRELSVRNSGQTSAENAQPELIDIEPLYRQSVEDLAEQFVRMVAPYKQVTQATYELDKTYLPEMALARKLIINGSTGQALHILYEATLKNDIPIKSLAKAYYNLGLLQTYIGDFDNALWNLNQALSLRPSSKRYSNAIRICHEEQDKAARFLQQTGEGD